MKENTIRDPFLDCLKAVAIFLVLCTHCKTQLDLSSNIYVQEFLDLALFANGVPIFFMVSGALMLGKERSNEYYIRKCCKILVLILLWSALQTVFCLFYRGETISLMLVAKHVFNQSLYYCNYIWFLCSLFALYVVTPIVNKFIDNSEEQISMQNLQESTELTQNKGFIIISGG